MKYEMPWLIIRGTMIFCRQNNANCVAPHVLRSFIKMSAVAGQVALGSWTVYLWSARHHNC